jgi:hypothetical protein
MQTSLSTFIFQMINGPIPSKIYIAVDYLIALFQKLGKND